MGWLTKVGGALGMTPADFSGSKEDIQTSFAQHLAAAQAAKAAQPPPTSITFGGHVFPVPQQGGNLASLGIPPAANAAGAVNQQIQQPQAPMMTPTPLATSVPMTLANLGLGGQSLQPPAQQNSSGFVSMIAPDGSVSQVDPAHIDHYTALGARMA